MHCPRCAHSETNVIDSRVVREGKQVRRRRACPSCGHRFTSYEQAEETQAIVVKQDGRREVFDPAKIRKGLHLATSKRKISEDVLDDVVDKITRLVMTSGEREISSKLIGEAMMEHLADLDPVAYIRFASVYLAFEAAEDFKKELRHLDKKRKQKEKEAAPKDTKPQAGKS